MCGGTNINNTSQACEHNLCPDLFVTINIFKAIRLMDLTKYVTGTLTWNFNNIDQILSR